VLVRGGVVVPTQTPARNSTAARRNPLQYTAAIDVATGSAAGELFWDDGVAISPLATGKYVLVAINATHDASTGSGTLVARPVVSGITPPATTAVDSLIILGASGASADSTKATANGKPVTVAFNSTTVVLTLTLSEPVAIVTDLTVQWTS
jgi:hypothetical protein